MSQEVEPSLLEYARFHGLIRDHLEDHPLQHLECPRDFWSDLEDNQDLFQIRTDTVKVPDERLAVDEGTASLLSSVQALAQQPPSRHGEDDEFDVHRVQRLKLELPLLRSDPEFDLLRFAPKIVPDLEHEFLPLETVDQEADEGLDWPTRCHDLPDEYTKKLESEKLEVSSDAMVVLQAALTYHHEGGNHEFFEDIELPYTKKTRVQPVSPPLSPMSPVTSPFVPSSDTGRIELLSDQTSPTRDELREAEGVILADDVIAPLKQEAKVSSQNSDPMLLDSESLGDIYSPLKGIARPPSTPPFVRNSFEDRKVKVPLSPAASEKPLPWERKNVPFSEALTEVIHDLPPPLPKPENVSSDDIDAFFEETIRPVGIKAERRIEQERLQEGGTALRISVPIMDFSLPVAPWNARTQRSESEKLADRQNALTEMKALHFGNHAWPLSGKVERQLRWTPFPAALGKVEIQETISDDALVEKYIARPDRVDVTTLTWKPEGLRILDELAEPEEELAEAIFPEERDIDSLIRKRKYELEAEETSPPVNNHGIETANTKTRNRNRGEAQPDKHDEPTFGTFSALKALDSYMSVRKGVVDSPKLTADKYFPIPTKVAVPATPPKTTALDAPAPAQEKVSMPSPLIMAPTSPTAFVVSASVLSHRKLARNVQRLYPSAEFIERDFTLYSKPRERAPSKLITNIPSQNSMIDEADMILSPSVGLIWMTLRKIKQRSLPGQVARSAVKERIAGASLRYERLVVLVHEDCNSGDSTEVDSIKLDNSDCEALIEFTNFCSALESEVQVIFVAGTEEDLAKWIVATMVKHGITDPAPKLIQDETVWEVFLRRAGMNAFASQAILADLKAPPDLINQTVSEDYGLAAFVKMSAEERYARFGTLLGGRRLLERVSKVLDARW